MDYGNTKTPSMYSRLGSATLLQLVFPRESQLQQSCTTQTMVHAGCFSVSIIHQTLAWTSGSLTCAQMLINACNCTQGCMDTVRQSAPLSTPGNQTRVSGVPVQLSHSQLSYIPFTHHPVSSGDFLKTLCRCKVRMYALFFRQGEVHLPTD